MPKDTFFNLPDEKRDSITIVSLEEFARNNYKSASISNIVDKLGIAKGSMYQYFENKKDLYAYIVEVSANTRMDFVMNNLESFTGDIYSLMKHLIKARTEFDVKYPLYKAVLANMLNEKFKDDELNRMQVRLNNLGESTIKDIIIKRQINGEIRRDITPDMMGFFISYVLSSIDQYMIIKDGAQFAKNFYSSINKAPQYEKLEQATDDIIELLKHGMLPRAND
jgi:AcrR family transcriptional regulator